MLLLTGTGHKIQLVTAAVTSVHVQTSWVDRDNTSGAETPGSFEAVITSIATTDIVAAPLSGVARNVRFMSVHAVGGAQQVVLQKTNGVTVVEICDPALGVDEHLIVPDSGLPAVLDASVALKTWNAMPGRMLRQTVYTSGSGATHTFQAGCTQVQVELVAGGGGGGGATFSTPNMGFGAGGAAGGYLFKLVTNPGTTLTYTVGTGGTVGANTGGTGGTGVDTTAVVNAVTYTAKGGLGGVGMVAAAAVGVAAGGDGVVPTNGDVNVPGTSGGNGIRVSATVGVSGNGGGGIYGHGGVGKTANAVGDPGAGFGGGGGGGAAVSASQTGGAGSGGVVIITEYS